MTGCREFVWESGDPRIHPNVNGCPVVMGVRGFLVQAAGFVFALRCALVGKPRMGLRHRHSHSADCVGVLGKMSPRE